MKKFSLFILIIMVIGVWPLPAQSKNRKIRIITSYGTMVILLSDQTPAYRDNFIRLVKKHFYDGLLFHRVIKNFMIQGGDPDSRNAKPGQVLGNGDVGYTLPASFHPDLFHQKGALAAARDENPQKASSGCQFYIVEGKKYTDAELDQIQQTRLDGRQIPAYQRVVYKTIGGTPFLDQNYTVFGQLIRGMSVLDKIAHQPTDSHDRPIKNIRMKIRLVHKFLFF